MISCLSLNLFYNVHGFLLDGLTSNWREPNVNPVEWIEESKDLSPELGGFDHSERNLVVPFSSSVAGHLEEFHGDLLENNAKVDWDD